MTKVKGTYDVLPEESFKWNSLESKIRKIFTSFGYKEIRTPIIEYFETIHRNNEESDMVKKETYDFLDHGDRKLTLRPEMTAGAIRSYVENKLYVNNEATRLYYMGPNFRYERPQKGRYRQFSQFGVELINASGNLADAEIIILIHSILKDLNISATINLNSIGDRQSRSTFNQVIRDYFNQHRDELCEDCIQRLLTNPLRILDCKVDNQKDFFINCPKPIDYLDQTSLDNFNNLLSILDKNKIPYVINKNLVRGLDYYDELVFEIIADVGGTNLAIGGGGRYNGLVMELGGPSIKSIGFSFGMERVLACIKSEEEKRIDAIVLFLESEYYDLSLLNKLRSKGLIVKTNLSIAPLNKLLTKAFNENPRFIIIVGSEEVKDGLYTLKNVDTKEQNKYQLKDLIKIIKEK